MKARLAKFQKPTVPSVFNRYCSEVGFPNGCGPGGEKEKEEVKEEEKEKNEKKDEEKEGQKER